jgi:replicative DNA helicase
MNILNANTASIETHSRHADEVDLLGCLMVQQDPVLYRAAAAIIGTEHFSDTFHARLFDTMGKGFDAGLANWPWSHWVLVQMRADATLKEMNWSASAMMAAYIARSSTPAIGVEGMARQIRHNHLAVQLEQAVDDGDTAAAEQIAAEMEKLSRAHLTKDAGIDRVGNVANAVVERLSDMIAHGVQPDHSAWTGSARLNEIFGGWRRGRLYVIGGRPGAGKTTTALSWLLRTARKGHGVMMFELEMTAQELTEVALCDVAWNADSRIEYRDLSNMTDIDGRKVERLIKANHAFQELPFVISDTPGLTIAEIRSQALQYAQRLEADGKRLDVVCIDHLNLVKASGRYQGNKVAETEEVSNALKALAKELKCAVIVLCQLNRGVEGREDKRPGLADLRWSGAVEQDADVVMFVYREAYYLSKPVDDPSADIERQDRLREVQNRLEVIVAKHRGGPTPVLEFYCDMGCGVVRDMEKR